MPTNHDIAELARRHGLTLDEATLSTTASGLDFLVAFAADVKGTRWVLRIPRRPDALKSARYEKRVLTVVAPHLSVQVPRWEIFTDEVIAYRQLEGHPAATIDMEAKAYVWRIDAVNVPAAFERSLAQAMAGLHSTDTGQAAAAGLRTVLSGQLRQDMHDRMLRVRSEFGVSTDLWRRWQKWLATDPLWPSHVALVHGDLHAGHILCDEAARVTGIIDWTEAAVGDPAIDFAGYRVVFGDDAAKRLIAAYGEAGGRTWPGMFDHIVELCAASGLTIAEFALSSGLDEYRQMARQVLGAAPA